ALLGRLLGLRLVLLLLGLLGLLGFLGLLLGLGLGGGLLGRLLLLHGLGLLGRLLLLLGLVGLLLGLGLGGGLLGLLFLLLGLGLDLILRGDGGLGRARGRDQRLHHLLALVVEVLQALAGLVDPDVALGLDPLHLGVAGEPGGERLGADPLGRLGPQRA